MNPYRIEGPALISFSGGRTSGYMLHEILRAHDGQLPEDVHVTFANTGKEREETLRFVHECESRWSVRIVWLERPAGGGFEVVGYNSASREGEPFSALIAEKKALPNWQARWCTSKLKIEPMHAYMNSLGFASFTEAVGLRADEGHRLLKMMARNEEDGRRCTAPLAKANVTRQMVRAWWRAQPFDLGLQAGEGNCDYCFMKGRKLKLALIREASSSPSWWAEKERQTGATFDRRDSMATLIEEVRRQPSLWSSWDLAEEEYDVECGLLCATDEAA